MQGARGNAGLTIARSGASVSTMVVTALIVAVLTSVGANAVAGFGSQGGASDEELIDRLVEIEAQVGDSGLEVFLDPETTWAEFAGDFVGTKVALDRVEGQARDLFITADESDGPVADAVAAAARGILLQREALGYLAEWESADLTFPAPLTFDSLDVAIGQDTRRGDAEAGFELLIEAFELQLPAYTVLRDTEAADATERSTFEGAYAQLKTFESETLPRLRLALSDDDTQVMATIDRFETAAPGVEARARSMTVQCIDRDAYETIIRGATGGDQDAVVAGLSELLADNVITVDCPDLDNENVITLKP